MRTMILLSLLSISVAANAQFYVVEDKDGYVNVRRDASTSSAVDARLMNGEIVYMFEPEGEWFNVDFTGAVHVSNGFVHSSRLKSVVDFSKIPGTGARTFAKDSIQVTYMSAKFNPENNKIKYHEGHVQLINGRNYYGADGDLPKEQYRTLTVTWSGQKIAVPDSALLDLFEPDPNRTIVHHDPRYNRLFVQAHNSDGAGSYSVLWLFENGEFCRRYIYHGF